MSRSNPKETPSPQKRWRPLSSSLYFLLPFLFFTFSLFAVSETLSWVSDRMGGISFADPNHGFGPLVVFAYLYLPTFVAIFYSYLWTWVDLNTKRLEPFFQMSREQGAAPRDSIYLNYPFQFIGFAPLRALRRKHMSVFFAGATTVIIFVAITPLIGAVFTTSIISRSIGAKATSFAQLPPSKAQFLSMSTSFEMVAYRHLWLGQNLPGFTTQEAAFAPFVVHEPPASRLTNITWTANTTMYYTTLQCESATVSKIKNQLSYSNRNGCTTQPGVGKPCSSCSAAGLYIGWYAGPLNHWYLSGMGCPSPRHSSTFLAIWGEDWGDYGPRNVTALFCEPHYWVQDANVTVDARHQKILQSIPIGSPRQLSKDKFNSSNFEFIIGTGSTEISPRADIANTEQAIDQQTKVVSAGWSEDATLTNMVAYAIGVSRLPMHDYMNATILSSSFEKAHQLLFALCIQSLLTISDVEAWSGQGTVRGETASLEILRPIAVAMEASLLLISVFVIMLWTTTNVRKNELHRNPASLTAIMNMIPSGSQNTEHTATSSQTEHSSKWLLRDGRLQIEREGTPSRPIPRKSGEPYADNKMESETNNHGERQRYIRPREMGYPVGFAFVAILVFALIILLVLRGKILKPGGLPPPSDNSSWNQVILKYLPVIFATLLDSFWTLLNRLLCMLRPLQELAVGEARASRSLDLDYTSLPSQFVLWRALRARHFLLAAVCVIAIVANLLAVSLNGLLETCDTLQDVSTQFSMSSKGMFTQGSYPNNEDHIYAAQANFDGKTSLDPWVGRSAYFLPFSANEVTEETRISVAMMKGRTTGLSAQLRCSQIELDTEAFIWGDASRFVVKKMTPSGRSVNCTLLSGGGPLGGQDNSLSATELWCPARAVSDDPGDVDICAHTVIAGFIRANLSLSGSQFKTDNGFRSSVMAIKQINDIDAIWLDCQASIASAMYDVTVDPQGRVLSEATVSAPESIANDQFLNGTSASLLVNITNSLITPVYSLQPWWHNDTFVDTWFGLFVKSLSMSKSVIDPTEAPPTFSAVAPVVEDVYARLFAIYLGLQPEWLLPAESEARTNGSIWIPARRIVMSETMFSISLSLLVFNILVAILYYACRPPLFLKQMPWTIAGVLALFEHSGLINEDHDGEMWRRHYKFGFGKYVGTDGKPHIGIERKPFVTPWNRYRADQGK